MAVDFLIGAKECSIDNCPPATGAYPFTFDNPIPIYVDLSFTYGNGLASINCVATGYITGYIDNNMYPHVRIDRQIAGYGDGYGGFWFNLGSAVMSQDYECHVTVYDDNGTKTEDYTTQGGLDATIWYGGNIPNGVVHVNHSTIPVILEENHDMSIYAYQTRNNFQEFGAWDTIRNNTLFDLHYILNAEDEVIPDGDDFMILIQWTTGEWINQNQPAVNMVYWQGVRGRRVSGDRLRLYTIAGVNDGKLKNGVKIKSNTVLYNIEVTTDGVNWTPVDEFPYSWVYRKHINELGEMGYALSVELVDVLHYPDEPSADNDPDEDADNWDDIDDDYPDNPTEDPDDETEMGEVFTRSFFSQQYICSASALQEISNAFFDTNAGGLFEDIKKGLEMYGDSVIDDIQNVMFFPVDLTSVFTSVQAQNYIYFGGYKFDMQHSVSKIIYPNGYKDFGSFFLKPTFKSYRDYAPYQRLYVLLPYCGWYELDIARYIGKTVSVRYYFDTRTGGCLACLFANGVLIDYYNGQCGVQMPITLTDFSSYANAQIQTLLGLNKPSNANAGVAGDFLKGVGSGAVESGLIGASSLGLATVGVGAGVSVTKTVYGLTQNNINNFNVTKGGSTSMLNQYLPQEVLFMFEIQDVDETSNAKALIGDPTNASGQIQNFSGYLEVDAVKLNCAGATVNEQKEIIQQLQNGIYI